MVVSEYVFNVASLCWRIQQTITREGAEELALRCPALFEEADATEQRVLKWIQTHAGPAASPEIAQLRVVIWNMYRSVRCKLLNLLIKLLNHVENLSIPTSILPSIEDRRRTCILTLRTMFQEILDSVLGALGELDSKPIDQALSTPRPLRWEDVFRVLASFKVIWWSELALPHQRQLAYIGLQRTVDEMGSRHAMVIPPYQEMLPEMYCRGCTRSNCSIHR